jgi:hypothetical protein
MRLRIVPTCHANNEFVWKNFVRGGHGFRGAGVSPAIFFDILKSAKIAGSCFIVASKMPA